MVKKRKKLAPDISRVPPRSLRGVEKDFTFFSVSNSQLLATREISASSSSGPWPGSRRQDHPVRRPSPSESQPSCEVFLFQIISVYRCRRLALVDHKRILTFRALSQYSLTESAPSSFVIMARLSGLIQKTIVIQPAFRPRPTLTRPRSRRPGGPGLGG